MTGPYDNALRQLRRLGVLGLVAGVVAGGLLAASAELRATFTGWQIGLGLWKASLLAGAYGYWRIRVWNDRRKVTPGD